MNRFWLIIKWALGLAMMVMIPSVGLAKQCIWNKGGYVLRVDWFAPTDLTLAAIEIESNIYCPPGANGRCQGASNSRSSPQEFQITDGRIELAGKALVSIKEDQPSNVKVAIKLSGKPVQTDEYPVGQGRCIGRPGGPYTAVVSAVGRTGAVNALRVFLSTLYLAGSAAGEVKLCGGVGCVLDYEAQLETITELTSQIVPNVEDIFYVGIPKSDKWLDTWGTVYEPVFGDGNSITAADQTATGCHLWTDDFDGWCEVEFDPKWGMKQKVGGGCPTGQGKAQCAAGYKGGVKLEPNQLVTGCHLWTDDFDHWCKVESKRGWGMKQKFAGGCMTGQGKALCAAGHSGGIAMGSANKLTGCHLWTDNFDGWCKHEFGKNSRLKQKDGFGCMIGQGKGVCSQ